MNGSRGVALIMVLWVVAVISAIALTLAGSARVEVRRAADDWEALQADLLAESGHQVLSYLETRGIGLEIENLDGLPVRAVVPSFHYMVELPAGRIDIHLESDNGKISLVAADREWLAGFFTLWTGDARTGQRVAAAVEDWRDIGTDVSPDGAEGGFYASAGYAPRDSGFGRADLPLLRDLGIRDLRPAVDRQPDGSIGVRESLDRYVTASPTGGRVNPSFAEPLVLESIPGMPLAAVRRIVEGRQREPFKPFKDEAEFLLVSGLPGDTPVRNRLTFDRGPIPAVQTVAVTASGYPSSERRVFEPVMAMNYATGSFETQIRLSRRSLRVH